jgi:hypothetical protein
MTDNGMAGSAMNNLAARIFPGAAFPVAMLPSWREAHPVTQ